MFRSGYGPRSYKMAPCSVTRSRFDVTHLLCAKFYIVNEYWDVEFEFHDETYGPQTFSIINTIEACVEKRCSRINSVRDRCLCGAPVDPLTSGCALNTKCEPRPEVVEEMKRYCPRFNSAMPSRLVVALRFLCLEMLEKDDGDDTSDVGAIAESLGDLLTVMGGGRNGWRHPAKSRARPLCDCGCPQKAGLCPVYCWRRSTY